MLKKIAGGLRLTKAGCVHRVFSSSQPSCAGRQNTIPFIDRANIASTQGFCNNLRIKRHDFPHKVGTVRRRSSAQPSYLGPPQLDIADSSSSSQLLSVSLLALMSACLYLAPCSETECEPALKKENVSDVYELGGTLGKGSFGVVRRATCRQTGQLAAVKELKRKHTGELDVVREVAILRRLGNMGGHDNIISLKDAYADREQFYVVTDLVNGQSVMDYLSKYHRCSEQLACIIVRDLNLAVDFLHKNGVIHNDIKPGNLMLLRENRKRRVKLIDFGCALSSDEAAGGKVQPISGTKVYWPPESLKSGECTSAADMWAIGCVLYIVLSGRHPFDLNGDSTEVEIKQRILEGKLSFDHPIWTTISPDAIDLLEKLLDPCPETRATPADVMNSPWIKRVLE